MARPPPIPPLLAHRIDRLAVLAHAFHRFAHHPLCDRYQDELVRLGHRTRICRGCTLALLGLILGAVAGWSSESVAFGPAAWLLPAAALSSALLPTGRSKVVRRWMPAFLLSAAAFHGPLILSAVTLSCAAAGLLLYRRRGPNRAPCATCPQRTFEVCAGFAAIVRREHAFRRLSGRWLAKEVG